MPYGRVDKNSDLGPATNEDAESTYHQLKQKSKATNYRLNLEKSHFAARAAIFALLYIFLVKQNVTCY